jgi:ABC-type spermidine/putrescine transport system permease subunit II
VRSLPKKTGTPEQTDDRRVHNPWPLKIFFLTVGIALFISTLTGLYMSYQRKRNRVSLAILFLAGIVVPIVLTFA